MEVCQACLTRSTMEAKFIALENESSKAEWLRNFLADISLRMKPIPSVSMHCDSQATIAKTKSKIFNGKNMHIHLKHNILRKLLEIGVIYIPRICEAGVEFGRSFDQTTK